MSIDTLYNYTPAAPVQITDELYSDVGSDVFQLGTVKRAFLGGSNLEIYDDLLDSNAVQLVENTDYELTEIDTFYTDDAGFTVYTGVRILNASYQAGNLYFTYKTIGSYTDVDSINTLNRKILNIKQITTDYAVLDDDEFNVIESDTTNGDNTVTMPAAANNEGRQLRVKQTTAGGKTIIDGKGAETIDGDADFYLQSKDNLLDLYCNSTGWKIIAKKSFISSGKINCSDWTNRHIGTVEIDYDNLNGAFTVGEVVSGANASGIITADDGSTLKIKEMTETGGGFLNDEEITGDTSGATADVDGNTKNADTDFFHNYSKNLYQLKVTILISTDETDDNSFRIGFESNSNTVNADMGFTIFQTDDNNLLFQSGAGGPYQLNDATGNVTQIDTEDWYVEIIIEVR